MLSVGSLAPRIENAELNSLGNFFPSFHFPYGMSKDGERPSPPIEKGNIGNQEQSLLTHISTSHPNLYRVSTLAALYSGCTLEPAWETPKIMYLVLPLEVLVPGLERPYPVIFKISPWIAVFSQS